jgi:hypothetical protein
MTQPLEREVVDPHAFALSRSPFYRALHRAHLLNKQGRPHALRIVAIAWLPLVIAALARLALHDRPAPILFDISVHVRLLVAIPLLIQAEKLLDERCRGAMKQLYEGNFAPGPAIDHILRRAERARDSRLAELVLFMIVLGVGIGGLAHVSGTTGLFAGVEDAGAMSFIRVWYLVVSLPIVQFLMARWLWHWAIWSYVVVRVSRLPLRTLATHPDHAGGLGFMSSPVNAFAGYVLAIAATIAGAWGTRILAGQAKLQAFIPIFIVFVIAALVIACAPLFVYMGLMYRTRHREIASYNRLALEFTRAFHHCYVDHLQETNKLGDWPDYSKLVDMSGSYESLVKIRLVPIGPRAILALWAAAIAPMLPLVATTMPLDKLLLEVGRALLGGLPA